ncbi:phthiocerol/phthiodiolone dimycocerosyl transferase [Mycobacterium shinjukuense]|uniref:Phthiocerol/phthiodiolone dimycocerosyl transferase n=1 Tax=Mycobacterium shinjukuense TaxID=398694 RepID=A0A7I7MLY0_9MYCO|nr:phthiocerol/phthiodiolone dimycocerosyl transferase [Mycobacterium shinjukuense]MCV6985975.1 phthiocerol/phthiodiolone dimycocerosyl transferase [Mycobacterium shinjukuense]ORB70511.1 acyltransferase [Mycobacterium shinjukuense]BBX72822.1 phthiocerol/phthiodiolone dimycocerosyl transferase [Mycobacterium shinjukuense]
MFGGSVIRKLSHSEEVFAKYEVFTSMTVRLHGGVDVDALSDAFDALVAAHPVLASHLEPSPDGGWFLVADDLLHSGICVVDGNNATPAGIRLDQTASLLNLRLTLGEQTSALTVYLHHSIADGHHGAGLLEELFTRYTAVVTTGDPGPVIPEPAPAPLEVVLQQRGVKRLGVSGVERFMPVMFAYDLPASVKPTLVATPGSPQAVPVTRVRLTEQQTADLVEFSRENRVSVNTVVAAAILLTEWRMRETPHVPIPYAYPVDLRYFLTPPVRPTESTNLVGVATYLAEIGPNTDIVDLATDIGATFRADLADGLIQQSALNFGVAFEGTPPGLPPLVFCTDVSALPVPTPEGLELGEFQGQFFCSITVPLDFYGCGVHGGQMVIEHHGHIEAQQTLEAIRALLCTVPAEYGWVME